MAFKIKDNLDLYGNQLLNFALQSDSGFPQSPQVGHMFNYTGAGVMANHAVMCVDETTKAFKALAFVDEIATNTAFTALTDRVETIEKALGEDTANVLDTWAEVQDFLKNINENDADLMTLLNSKLDKSGGTIGDGKNGVPLSLNGISDNMAVALQLNGTTKGFLNCNITWGTCLVDGVNTNFRLGITPNGTPYYSNKNSFSEIHTLLHSGNIGEYKAGDADKLDGINSTGFARVVSYPQTSDSNWNIQSGIYSTPGGTEGLPLDSNGHQVIHCNWDGNAANQLFLAFDRDLFAFRRKQNNVWNDWKTIAFTDSTVAAAQKLVTSAGADAVTIDSNKNAYFENIIYGNSQPIVFKNGNDNVAYFGAAHSTISSTLDGVGIMARGTRGIYFSTNGSVQAIINPSGNVTIGGSDLAGTDAKLHIDGNLRIGTEKATDTTQRYLYFWKGDGTYRHRGLMGVNENGAFWNYYNPTLGTYKDLVIGPNGLTYANSTSSTKAFVIDDSGNVGIGTSKPQKKLHVVGDLYVEGNIIATKEVSAGGAGQEGESGDGGAEVLAQQLAKGQSTYTITNTIKRSDIAVSLYEWNANNSSWDMCLADISVKDTTITVTFGSATSVNHKLVAVG